MNSPRKIDLTPTQICIIMIRAMIGVGIIGMSRSATEKAKQDGWISVILAGMIASFFVLIFLSLLKRFEGLRWFEIIEKIVGKILGKIIGFGYCIYFMFISSLILRYLVDLVSVFILRETPEFVLYVTALMAVLYVSIGGVDVIAKSSELILVLILPLTVVLFIVLKNGSVFNLLPVGEAGFMNVMKGVLPTFYSFAGYEIIFIYYYYLKKKEKAKKYSLGAMIYTIVVYLMTVLGQIYLYGHEQLQQILFPTIKSLGNTKIPVIERLEIFIIFIWVLALLNNMSIYYFTAFHGMFEISTTRFFKNLKERYIGIALLPVVFYLAQKPKNIYEVLEFSHILGYGSLFFGGMIPVVLLFMAMILRKGKKI